VSTVFGVITRRSAPCAGARPSAKARSTLVYRSLSRSRTVRQRPSSTSSSQRVRVAIISAGESIQPETQDIRLKFERQQAYYVLKPLPVHVPATAHRPPRDPRWPDANLAFCCFGAGGLRRQEALATYEPRTSRVTTFWTRAT
jgi:hypothetical protein